MENTITELSVSELITAIGRSLVDMPEEVSVNETSNESSTILRLRVDPTDVGKVIGKQGRTARSLRTILGAISVKLKHRYSLEIVEEVHSHPDSQG
ncbi:MAG TPA: KH domain-containing protein [Acidobacteriaceae bacterium]|nr:KH domain-containing protein [Acidobacteriaceae bacterium]